MSLKSYASYKQTDVEWVGEIPVHWTIGKFRYTFTESHEKIQDTIVGLMLSVSGYRGIEIKEYDDENRRRLDEDLMGYRVVRKGQLVVNTMWLNYAGLGISDLEGHVSPAYRCYWISDGTDKRFLHFLMRSDRYVKGYTKFLTGIRPNSLQMSRDDLLEFPILKPPIEEQVAIAIFLDHEVAKIDALIVDKQRFIELLREKHAALISNAVTKGLNPSAPMKNSGIEWLGVVPQHWEIYALKRIASLKSGESITADDIEQDGDFPVYGGNGLRGYTKRYTHEGFYVLIGRQGALCGNINYAYEKFWASEHAVVVSPIRPVEMIWLGELLRSMNLNQYSISAAQPGLSVEIVSNLSIPVPPIQEQTTIAAYLGQETSKITTLVTEANQAITLLQERRSALISAAVTGKIDVRELVERKIS